MSAAPPSVTVISGCAVATVDALGTEHATGHVVVEGTRIVAVGPGAAGPEWRQRATKWIDGKGLLATPAWSTLTITCINGSPAVTRRTKRFSVG